MLLLIMPVKTEIMPLWKCWQIETKNASLS